MSRDSQQDSCGLHAPIFLIRHSKCLRDDSYLHLHDYFFIAWSHPG